MRQQHNSNINYKLQTTNHIHFDNNNNNKTSRRQIYNFLSNNVLQSCSRNKTKKEYSQSSTKSARVARSASHPPSVSGGRRRAPRVARGYVKWRNLGESHVGAI